jgi:plastocyanin
VFWITAALVLIVVVLSLIVKPDRAYSQALTIYNTTGNITMANGMAKLSNINEINSKLPRFPVNSTEQPKININTPKSVTEEILHQEYPLYRVVQIVKGAALKGNAAFNPEPATVHTGGIVYWVNDDLVTHTITSGMGFNDPLMGEHFDSGLIGSSYQHRFDQPGIYDYFCQVHPSMIGKIIVRASEKS